MKILWHSGTVLIRWRMRGVEYSAPFRTEVEAALFVVRHDIREWWREDHL